MEEGYRVEGSLVVVSTGWLAVYQGLWELREGNVPFETFCWLFFACLCVVQECEMNYYF